MKKGTFVISYISYILVLAVTVFCAVFYLQTFFFLLLILVVCLPVFSWFLTGYCFKKLAVSLDFIPLATTKNETAVLSLSVNNPTRIPFASLTVPLTLRSLLYSEEESNTHILSLRPLNANKLTFPVVLTKSGLYEAEILKIEGFDYLHLFHFSKTVGKTTQLRVFPNTLPRRERHEALYSEGFDEFEESNKSGNVSSNVTDIREYRPGDRLQKIHWKLSSKIDKLMVKENESTSTNEFFVLLELYQPREADCGKDSALLNALDTALDEAWGISMELIQAGEIFSFAVYSTTAQDFVMSTIRSAGDLENAFLECFYEPSYETENLALDIYEKSGMKKGTLLHITHKGVLDVPSEI